MNHIIPLLPFLLLLHTTLQDNNYTPFKLISNHNHYDKVLFIDQLNLAILYGQSNKNASAYHAYNWVAFTYSPYTDFFLAPNYMEIYYDPNYDASIVYSNTNGKIRQKSFNSDGESI